MKLTAFLFTAASADMYLQWPPGGNNRLSEENREVRNNKRLFDSQNNNRCGYNQGPLEFYTQSTMNLEWMVQHSCGEDSNTKCDMILQYTCGDQLRDGRTTDTIPTDQDKCEDENCNTDFKFGMHENRQYYQHCSLRERQKGLFRANQRIHGQNARFTRQDNQGTRFGYECNEERDYYPYWHPTIWKDIAVLTDDLDRCKYYETESENVKDRYFCKVPDEWLEEEFDRNSRDFKIPLNETACIEFAQEENVNAVWTKSSSHNIEKPECKKVQYSKDNHLGNANGRQLSSYQWTIPEDLEENNCVIRIRYNITVGEFDGWNTFATNDIVNDRHCECRNNFGVDLWSKFGMSGHEARDRNYQLEANQNVEVFKGLDFKLKMAFNTDQTGRVFEDRTHVFKINKLPEDISKELKSTGRKLWNLNARGKIGNKVEVFPNTEYTYNPQVLKAKQGDYLHIQWTGSDTNDRNYDGSQVKVGDTTVDSMRKKDRHNMVLIDKLQSNQPSEDNEKLMEIFGWSSEEAMKLAFRGIRDDGRQTFIKSENTKLSNARYTSGKWWKNGQLSLDPKYAIDGEIRGEVNHFAHPERNHERADFLVDAEGTTPINHIIIYPRTNCCWDRYESMQVLVNDKVKCKPLAKYDHRYVWHQYRDGKGLNFVCEETVVPKQIRVVNKNERSSRSVIQIQELVVNDNLYEDAPVRHFSLPPKKLNTVGTWNFMSTFNHRFGLRTQKGTVRVEENVLDHVPPKPSLGGFELPSFIPNFRKTN